MCDDSDVVTAGADDREQVATGSDVWTAVEDDEDEVGGEGSVVLISSCGW